MVIMTDRRKELIGHLTLQLNKEQRLSILRELMQIEGVSANMTQTLVVDDAWYARLDSGIRFAVRVLHAAGVETCQSCEGGPGHAYDRPTIDLPAGNDADGFRALAALVSYGFDVLDVSMIWPVISGLPTERLWRLTLRRAYPERADERPMFDGTVA